MKKGRIIGPSSSIRALLGAQLNSIRARPLRAGLDLERNLFATHEGVEILDAGAVEEVFLAVLGCDEAEAAIRHQLLDGSCSHLVSPPVNPWTGDSRCDYRALPLSRRL